jgi:AsmA protein
MQKPVRLVLIAVAAVVALIVIAVTAVPIFLNTDSFRTKIESTLTHSLGRKVTIGKLDLSVWSGGLVAENR